MVTFPMILSIYAGDTTLYSKRDEALQVEVAFGLEFDLGDTMEWGRNWLVDFSAWKAQNLSFHRSDNYATENFDDATVERPQTNQKFNSCSNIPGWKWIWCLNFLHYVL